MDADTLIVGSGVSGSAIAQELTRHGQKVLMLEAGSEFDRRTFPREELDGSAQLYWGGGIELDSRALIGLLRPKVLGGGSVVNQALMDRFDASALDDWRRHSGIEWFSVEAMDPWYERAEAQVNLETIPRAFHNGNARIFETGFRRNGYRLSPLRRAQKHCRWERGNDCIECLQGCPRDSKQSALVTTLKRAREHGLQVVSRCEAVEVKTPRGSVEVLGRHADGRLVRYRAGRLVLAAGAIGNCRLLLQSGFTHPALGKNFFTHPQDMVLARYDHLVDAHRGPFQAWKSDDPGFRRKGFKLENVFAPPVALAMLIPRLGAEHRAWMRDLRRIACVEVAIRDTSPGTIRLAGGKVVVDKPWNDVDRLRREEGLTAIRNIFRSTGAREIVEGNLSVGLHLMGGCALGTDPGRSVTAPDFRLHDRDRVFVADSSVFPSAPGINPSLTILALSLRAAAEILREADRGA